MPILGIIPKDRCSICGKRYYAKYCSACRRKDFSLCYSCHNKSSHHKQEVSRLHAR